MSTLLVLFLSVFLLSQVNCFKLRRYNRSAISRTTPPATVVYPTSLSKDRQSVLSTWYTESTICTEVTSSRRKTFKSLFPPFRPIRRTKHSFLPETTTEGWSHETMDYILRHFSKNLFNKTFYDMFPESASQFCLKSTQQNKYIFFFECSNTINWRPEFSEIRNYFGTTKILVFFQLIYSPSAGNASVNVPGIKYTIITQPQPRSSSRTVWHTEGWLHSKRNQEEMNPERYRKPHRFHRFPYWDENMVYKMKKNVASNSTWTDYVSWNPVRHTVLSRYFGTTKIMVKFYGPDDYKYILMTQSQPRWTTFPTMKTNSTGSRPNTSKAPRAVLRRYRKNEKRYKKTTTTKRRGPKRTRRSPTRTRRGQTTTKSSPRPWWLSRKTRTTLRPRKIYIQPTTKAKMIYNYKSRCYVCGLNFTGIPNPICHLIFGSSNMRYQTRKKYYKTHCIYHKNKWRDTQYAIYGPAFIGGCFYRTLDIGETYDERGCRTWPPDEGISFASRRFASLERMLEYEEEACIHSPFASLTPFSRGISLYARYRVCVCSGNYCNAAHPILSPVAGYLIVFIMYLHYCFL